MEFEDDTLEMRSGDYLDIPAHRKHRVSWTTPDEPTIWLPVHYGGEE
jgi:cupin 2 domain-containing protein